MEEGNQNRLQLMQSNTLASESGWPDHGKEAELLLTSQRQVADMEA